MIDAKGTSFVGLKVSLPDLPGLSKLTVYASSAFAQQPLPPPTIRASSDQTPPQPQHVSNPKTAVAAGTLRAPRSFATSGEIGGGRSRANTVPPGDSSQQAETYLQLYAKEQINLAALLKVWEDGLIPTPMIAAAMGRGDIPSPLMLQAWQEGRIHDKNWGELISAGACLLFGLPTQEKLSESLVDQKGYLRVRHELIHRMGFTVPVPTTSKYLLKEKIGSGGNSDVYRAIEEPSGREVAVKILKSQDEADRKALNDRVRDEMLHKKIYAHGSFVQVYYSGETAQGDPFIVQELLVGGTVESYIDDLKSGKIPYSLEKIIDLACQILLPLALMHENGLVHRDVKPGNSFLDDQVRPKLGDRGLAMVVPDPPVAQDTVFGTPMYLSPESLSGWNKANRDVWAFGVLLYELLTLKVPFPYKEKDSPPAKKESPDGGAEENKDPFLGLWKAILQDQPIPPSEAAPHRGISKAIDEILMKCLEKDLDPNVEPQRYKNAGDVLAALLKIKFQVHLDAAEAHLKSIDDFAEVERRIKRSAWLKGMEKALHELETLYKEYPVQSVLQKRLDVYMKIHEWAEKERRDLLEEIEGHIVDLAPQSPEASRVTRKLTTHFIAEGEFLNGRVQMIASAGGILIPGSLSEPRRLDRLEYGRSGAIVHFDGGVDGVSVSMPVPTHVDSSTLRVPSYLKLTDVPHVPGILVPAGETFVMGGMQYVDRDYFVMPLRTGADYLECLEAAREEYGPDSRSFENQLPYGWVWDDQKKRYLYRIGDKKGQPVDLQLPIEISSLEASEKYLERLSRKIGFRCDNISLYEWMRLLRGNSVHVYPWGEAPPTSDMVVYNLYNLAGGRARNQPVSLDAVAHHDFSPFSRPDMKITHVLGNTRKFVSMGRLEEMALIAVQHGLSVPALKSDYYLTVGGNYADNPPATPDVIGKHLKSSRVQAGIMPVLRLQTVPKKSR